MTNKICKISLFSLILATVSALPGVAAVKTKNSNRSYADAYNQVNAIRYQQEYLDANAANATTASAVANLPVMVADEKLASAILNNTSELVSMSDLENCAMVYPNGVFRWDIPESGIRRNQTHQCVAVISLIDANTNAVLATTTLASGDSFKCNIDNFPESGMNAVALSKTELPADRSPTMEDVEAVMNAEQKQNAGLKIAAGAIIAGVAGNMLAKKEAGSTALFGTGKDQIIGTAAGIATGAGVMAASSYSGKVAGDTINSVAVNAASGMIVGNMLAGANGGDTILDIQKCKIADGDYAGERDCIAGTIDKRSNDQFTETDDVKFFIINKNGIARGCKPIASSTDTFDCSNTTYRLIEPQLEHNGGSTDFYQVFGYDKKDAELPNLNQFVPVEGSATVFKKVGKTSARNDNEYFKVYSTYTADGAPTHAYIVFKDSIHSPFGGYKKSDFAKLQKDNSTFEYYSRNSSGSVGEKVPQTENETLSFTPSSIDATHGGLVDLNNQARTKGTLAGTAAGGALGGFAGYQGAKSEITDRWTAAVREYEDSLSNFVCMTGGRYLSKYNDYVEIPTLKKD